MASLLLLQKYNSLQTLATYLDFKLNDRFIMINDFNISFLVNLENDVSDAREFLSYAVIDGVKFDQSDIDIEVILKVNVHTHNELFDVLHTQSDGNYAACSTESESESTGYISASDHGDAQSLNKSPRKKRKLVKTKRATLAKLPEISTSSSIVNKSTQESNIGGDIVKELCL
jgi:hypothetical protein